MLRVHIQHQTINLVNSKLKRLWVLAINAIFNVLTRQFLAVTLDWLTRIKLTNKLYSKGKVVCCCSCHEDKGKGKGKAIPVQASTGPEGSRKLRLPNFKTIGT